MVLDYLAQSKKFISLLQFVKRKILSWRPLRYLFLKCLIASWFKLYQKKSFKKYFKIKKEA